jgi:D-hexose-6-phosphate mutarotase
LKLRTIEKKSLSLFSLKAPHVIEIVWEDKSDKIIIEKNNFSDLVIWNPHEEATAKMTDLQPTDWTVH